MGSEQQQKIDTLKAILPEEELAEKALEVPEGELPVWFYWEEFVVKYLRTGRSIHTVRSVRDVLRLLLRNSSLRSIEQFSKHTRVEDILHELKAQRGVSDTTLNSYLKNLKTYFIWLERQEYITENKLKKIMKCSERTGKQLTATEQEVDAVQLWLLNRTQTTLERKRNMLFFGILRFTGARPIEIEQMTLEDIYSTREGYKMIIYGAKQNKDPRYYALPSWLRDIYLDYSRYRSAINRIESPLLISSSKRSGWTRKGMTKVLIKASEELSFKISAYSVRRYVATKLHTEGVALHKIADYLGHKKVTTTLSYIESSCVRTFEASEIMARAGNIMPIPVEGELPLVTAR